MQTQGIQKQQVQKVLFIAALLACATPYVSAPVALLGGFLFSHAWGHPFPGLGRKATNWLLKASVVGLGFGMDLQQALRVGQEGVELALASIVAVFALGFLVSGVLHVSRRTAHLVASGTAICGGSAIAAVAPVVNASEKEISVALGTVFLLNAVALFVFPAAGHLLDLTQHQFGLWSAIAIHDTSSVIGAAATYGQEALQVATTVKLARALWIVPVALVSTLVFKSDARKMTFPWFIGLFVIALLANSYFSFVGQLGVQVAAWAKSGLVVTLFLVGADLSVENLKAVGWRPLALGVILWAFVSVASLLVILHL
ncbi:putative sulfate exporter family transporter [Pontibacter sp. E15-1]|uniref:YeiH family protein n=1 Tax=Pontibacter sp. E15-1 TaxID=2919918 RepID=UPI001F4FC517|nr:putative sulfate exporter family transporter [Pontibacter sp. E15-1]MCJ8165752.1 putative sulfate exporter family transporter [Pontibacter sp. E15-1]